MRQSLAANPSLRAVLPHFQGGGAEAGKHLGGPDYMGRGDRKGPQNENGISAQALQPRWTMGSDSRGENQLEEQEGPQRRCRWRGQTRGHSRGSGGREKQRAARDTHITTGETASPWEFAVCAGSSAWGSVTT